MHQEGDDANMAKRHRFVETEDRMGLGVQPPERRRSCVGGRAPYERLNGETLDAEFEVIAAPDGMPVSTRCAPRDPIRPRLELPYYHGLEGLGIACWLGPPNVNRAVWTFPCDGRLWRGSSTDR